MKAEKRFLADFSVFHLIMIAMCAGLGIAIKPIIVPLTHIVTGPLFIPGGAVAGGFYMLFIVLAASLTGKPGAASLACAVQAIIVIITGVAGSHGIMSLVTYVLPGVMVDLFLLAVRRLECNGLILFFAGLIANFTGTFLSSVVFFRLPLIPLMLALLSAALSGGLGGLISWGLTVKLRKLNPIYRVKDKENTDEE